jgi:hypothetical protein
LYERQRWPPVDGLVPPVELGTAADEAALEATCEVAKVVGTDMAAEEAAPGKLIDEYWKNPPAATLEVAMRLTAFAVDTDDTTGAIVGAPPTAPAGGETVMVTHSVVVVVVVELQELAAAALTFSTPSTAEP